MSNRNDGPVPRLRQLGEENITLPVGSGLSISWLTLQVILFFVACLICACCSLSSYVWSSVTLQITVPAPVITPRPTHTPAATDAKTEPASPTAETTMPVSPIQTPTPMPPSTPLPTSTNVPPPPPAGSPPAQAQIPLLTGMPQPPPAGLSGLRIVRVEWLPVGEEWGEEHIVIENQGADDQDLSGWTMNNDKLNTYWFPEGFVLRSQSQARVWAKGGTDTDSDLYWGSEQEIGDNAGGAIYLRDHAGTLIDLSSWKPTEGDFQAP